MKIFKLNNFTRGWIVGDFEPSIFRTKDFEVAVMSYQAGDAETRHTHRLADEITVINSGSYMMNNQKFEQGDIILIPKGKSTDFQCLESGTTTVIKMPSIPNDKYLT